MLSSVSSTTIYMASFLCLLTFILPTSGYHKSTFLSPFDGKHMHYPFQQNECPYVLEKEPCPFRYKLYRRRKQEKTKFQPLADQRIGLTCATGPTKPCNFQSKYRTIDGSCNNIKNPIWGMVGTSLTRLLPANYNDGIKEPRKMSNKRPLPSARLLRTTFFHVNECPSDINSVILMYWGQLVAHDTTHLSRQNNPDGTPPVCCPNGQGLEESANGKKDLKTPDNCISIKIPENDEFYSQFKITCLGMTRAITTDQSNCPLKPVQQVIEVTHFMDSSPIYGSRNELADVLRTFSGGKLKHQEADRQTFLPNIATPTARCNVASDSAVCFEAGDDRVDQNPGIAMLQTMFMREHNRLCEELGKINPSWDDERLYQESKRIVNAELQHITYSTFIVALLGYEYSVQTGLKVDDGYANTYDPDVNPNTINEVASAAYRAFHTLTPLSFLSSTQKGCPLKLYRLADFFSNPGIIRGEKFSNFMYGMEFLPSNAENERFSNSVANLFRKLNQTDYGFDLAALDIQRGRDTGLPTYTKVKEACGYGKAKNFDDLSDMISKTDIKKLKALYNKVDDIDLMVGGLLERKIQDSTVGMTFQCLLKEQFYRWRWGDRYFYNLKGQPGSFTKGQLREIQKVSLARLFCDNVSGTTEVAKDIFRLPSKWNKMTPCTNIPAINLSFWIEV